jgi:hypothetical protein
MKVAAPILLLCLAGCGEAEPRDRPPEETPNACFYAENDCGEQAPVDWSPTAVDAAEAYNTFSAYDNASCPDQVVIEVSAEALGRPDVYLFRQFAPGAIMGEEECKVSQLHVTVLTKTGDKWNVFDDYFVGGIWNGSGCDSKGAGKLGPREVNDSVAHPYSWLDLSGDIEIARVVISGEVDCETRDIQVGFVSSR